MLVLDFAGILFYVMVAIENNSNLEMVECKDSVILLSHVVHPEVNRRAIAIFTEHHVHYHEWGFCSLTS